ncbi:HNH endonuclease [Mechercharimyces sp. CAU 1602]|uniref:HNH endonuclease n=1 Tax=Mechercharimyces sp. CAU 1602 TaxID=2973933 RepID=UPI0021611237|nr:HNH endonuclease [Mechercharimyces sp. CAU 1602]MCS1350292.1 HNH endonuclease [Mechercharimyces sp. CAU 1602]
MLKRLAFILFIFTLVGCSIQGLDCGDDLALPNPVVDSIMIDYNPPEYVPRTDYNPPEYVPRTDYNPPEYVPRTDYNPPEYVPRTDYNPPEYIPPTSLYTPNEGISLAKNGSFFSFFSTAYAEPDSSTTSVECLDHSGGLNGFDLFSWILFLILAILALVFIFLVPGLGWSVFAGMAFGGLFSWLEGDSLSDIAMNSAVGGIAGLVGLGVYGVTTRLLRPIGRGMTGLRWLPKVSAGSTSDASDSMVTDLLTEGKVNWKNALLAGLMGGLLAFGGGALSNNWHFAAEGKVHRYPKVDLHSDAGKTFINKEGKWRYINWEGKEKKLLNGRHADQKASVKVNGTNYEVPFDSKGFPEFEDWSRYETTLPKKYWFTSDRVQFNRLSKEVFIKMNEDEKLRGSIDEAFLETIKFGVGSKNRPVQKKIKTFIESNDKISKNITVEEKKQLISGYGSESLYQKVVSDESLLREFLQTNYSWVRMGRDPVGFTWHHHQEPGKMMLVKSRVHGNIRHVGGRQIWCNGR